MQVAVNLLGALAMVAVGGLGGVVSQQGTHTRVPSVRQLAGSRED